MASAVRNSVCAQVPRTMFEVWTDHKTEHTLLITEDGVEILTARLPDSPGGKIPMPEGYAENGTKIENNAPA